MSEILDWPGQINGCLSLTSAHGQPFVSLQSVWAEILTGRAWSDADCPGYRRPLSSLNDCEVMSEDKLLYPASAAQPQDGSSLVINMPLLIPNQRTHDRTWLSDGSLPIHTVVSPAIMAMAAPCKHYRARPFPTTACAQVNLAEAIAACLENEKQRLKCTLHLMKTKRFQVAFIRITVFDLLAHLLGADYLSCRQRLIWPQIKSFLDELDNILSHIMAINKDSRKLVLSAFKHKACRARLNLNQLLSEGGYCGFREFRTEKDSKLVHRIQALQTLHAEDLQGSYPISLNKQIDSATTAAASPVYGSIYINRTDRFADGIVSQENHACRLKEIQQYLQSTLSREFGENNYVFPIGSNNPDAETAIFMRKEIPRLEILPGPELVVSIPGVDLHDTANSRAVDQELYPRSTHDYQGFVWFSDANKHSLQSITTIDVNRYLTGPSS